MYVLRAHLRTGLAVECNFENIGTGTTALDALTRARNSGTPVQILDDAGRQSRFSGADLLAETLIDVEAESGSLVRLALILQLATKAEKQRLGMVDPSDQRVPPFGDHTHGQPSEQPRTPRLVFTADETDLSGSQLLPPEGTQYRRADPALHAPFSS